MESDPTYRNVIEASRGRVRVRYADDNMVLLPDEDAGDERALTLAPDDCSVAVHSCHGALRELEVLRLCDGEGLSQEQAASSMHVSRGTVQRTLAAARKNLADALVAGHAIVIGPGEKES